MIDGFERNNTGLLWISDWFLLLGLLLISLFGSKMLPMVNGIRLTTVSLFGDTLLKVWHKSMAKNQTYVLKPASSGDLGLLSKTSFTTNDPRACFLNLGLV